MTIYLDAPVELGFQRIEDRSKDNIEKESLDFFKKVWEQDFRFRIFCVF